MEEIRKRLFSWASVLDAPTLAQAERTASMPFIFPHVALMPDAHLGKGATVGSVIPTLGAVIPAAVGSRHRLWHDRRPHPVHQRRRGSPR